MVWPETDGSGLTPNMVAPTTNATAATTSTARKANTIVTASLATSSRVRPTGRISRYRRVPWLASPATASPAMTDTATGRNTGSTRARAAAGDSAPLLSTAPRKAEPSPGLGPIPVTFRNTATSVGSPASSPMLTQVRGLRTSLRSSTRNIRRLLGGLGRVLGRPGRRLARSARPARAVATGVAGPRAGTAGLPPPRAGTTGFPGARAGQLQEHILQRGALDHQLADGHAAGDQVAVERLRAGAVELDEQAVGPPISQLHAW